MFMLFCQLHVHCIDLARGMMRMRIPSNYNIIIYSGCNVIIFNRYEMVIIKVVLIFSA